MPALFLAVLAFAAATSRPASVELSARAGGAPPPPIRIELTVSAAELTADQSWITVSREGDFSILIGAEPGRLAPGTHRGTVRAGDAVIPVAFHVRAPANALLPPAKAIAPQNTYALAAGDFDEDGHADVAATLANRPRAALLLGDGAGGFKPGAEADLTIVAVDLAAADMDGDGHLDLAALSVSNCVILRGDGRGRFSTPRSVPGGGGVSLTISDLDADGKPDLIIVTAMFVRVVLSDGSERSYRAGNEPHQAAVADFDGDGRPDIAVTNFRDGTVSVIFDPAGNPGVVSEPFRTGGDIAHGIAAADFNRDGWADLAVALGGTQGGRLPRLAVLLNNRQGGFTTSVVPTAADATIVQVSALDADGDGAADLLLEHFGTRLMLGTGDGTFAPALLLDRYAGQNLSHGSFADFNEDGRPDFAAPSISAAGLGFLLSAERAPASVQLTAPAYPVKIGPVQLEARVTSAGLRPPAGEVRFLADGKQVAAVGLSNGLARSNETLGTGIHSITAEYSGDGGTLAAVSAASAVKVTSRPVWAVRLDHKERVLRGQAGARMQIVITNDSAYNASGPLQVALTLPRGLTAASLKGRYFDWACEVTRLRCVVDDVFAWAGSWPLDLEVDVAPDIGREVVIQVDVSGGGAANGSVSETIPILDYPRPIATLDFLGVGQANPFFYDPVTGDSLALVPNVFGSWSEVRQTLPKGYTSVSGGDLDGDGKSELMFYQRGTGVGFRAAWRDGSLRPGPFLNWAANWDDAWAADMDGDRRTDLVFVHRAAGSAGVVFASGGGSQLNFRGSPHWMRPGDFNGDGKGELLALSLDPIRGWVSFLNFQERVGEGYKEAEFGDFNSDGATDWIMVQPSGEAVVWMSTTGVLKLRLPAGFRVVRAGNFSGDHRDGVLLYDPATGSGQIGSSDGRGGFSFRAVQFGAGYDVVQVQDLNGDGRADLVLYNSATGAAALGAGDGEGRFRFQALQLQPGLVLAR